MKISNEVNVLLCGIGVIVSFLLNGIALEHFTKDGKFTSELSLLCISSGIFAIVGRFFAGKDRAKIPTKTYYKLAGTYLGGMWLSTFALRFVSYPTRVIGKCCKAIPVMVMNHFRGTHKYKINEISSVVLIVVGMILFSAFNKSSNSDTQLLGIIILMGSLICDGFTGSKEDEIIDEHKLKDSPFELMYGINRSACIISGVAAVLTGDAWNMINGGFNQKFGQFVFAYSSSAVLGQIALFYTLSKHGAVVLSIITALRKCLMILGSVLYFRHSLTIFQASGLVFVVCGIVYSVAEKTKKKTEKCTSFHKREEILLKPEG